MSDAEKMRVSVTSHDAGGDSTTSLVTLNVPVPQEDDIAELEGVLSELHPDILTSSEADTLERAIATLKALKEIHNAG